MLQVKTQDPASVILKRLQKCQSTGFIQLDNLDLSVFPNEVPNIAELRFDTQKWWDIVPITKLDLSNNKIKEIPEEISNLNELVSFRMLNNHLFFLPTSLFLIQTLKSVDFSNNQISELPPTFIQCSSLVEANMRLNRLEVLPTHYSGLWNLEILDLSENNIKSFRLAEGNFPRLKRLDLSKNQLQSLDACLGSLTELESLNLSKNKLAELPQDVFRSMHNLKLIDLKENKLVNFEELPQNSKLDTLLLSYNQLKSVKNLHNAPTLTVLDLKNNKLERLDPSLQALKELKTLDVSNNDLPDIPNEIGFMNKLVRISLEGNPLKAIRSNVRSAGTEAFKKYLRERTDTTQTKADIVQEFTKVKSVDVWDQFIKDFLVSGRELSVTGQGITFIHDKFCMLNLVVLDLSNNAITDLNPNLARLSNLQKLRLNSNKLTNIDGRILGQLGGLEELELRNNKLEDLFEDINWRQYGGVLLELKHLDISQNKLDHIPEFITCLYKLRVLVLAHNAIKTMSTLFTSSLQKLETLDLSNNKIDKLEDSVMVLESLQQLNCEYNNITNFPTVLGHMKNLKNLLVYGNPIKNIRREIISKGSKHILDYLQSKHPVDPNPPMQIEQKQQYQQQQEKESTRMEIEQEGPYQKGSYQGGSQYGQNQRITPQQKPQMQYNPQNYMGGNQYNQNQYNQNQYQNQFEEQKMSEQQSGVNKKEVQNEVNALEANIAQLEKELQENFTLSTAMIMKKKKEINSLRSKKNVLQQALR